MDMILFEQAFEIVLNTAFRTGSELVPFTGSLNRILAGNVVSDLDMPPFNKSSVDGFACRKADLDKELEIIETIAAGNLPFKSVSALQCSRIMTGAPVPGGADCVIMVEDTELMPSGKVRYTGIFKKENIAIRGEDVKKGDTVLRPGRIIRPQETSCGRNKFRQRAGRA
jgi:molybdopterin molybdotransferase